MSPAPPLLRGSPPAGEASLSEGDVIEDDRGSKKTKNTFYQYFLFFFLLRSHHKNSPIVNFMLTNAKLYDILSLIMWKGNLHMCFKHAKTLRRITAFTLAICFVTVFLLADGGFLVPASHEHKMCDECAEAQVEQKCNNFHKCCKICLHTNSIKNLNYNVASLDEASARSALASLSAVSESILIKAHCSTLISLKTRLNN